ncbi:MULTISPECIES: hypothetical protein [Leptolyngbya]|uniref:S-layer protein n=3 Tax=Leptolyngbya boryana TaxID=1184 RepID=A0A1Z4JAA1_LEPBY|nr:MULTISPECIES: hypothetical protein [Leptolyngbya]BAS54343.1 hypothetical protein LBWT_2340 [Leptolyngbya boryana IAM M-101]BAS60691.1 hypothetical protein LBDG_02340 [Leptolyngbya boryana dg5]BAY53598.1 S-layer protein [Leptolyngbya boryana NIES-2135]MBD1855770.1 hypothetical protein [Leptolyngbya sp. FACHB-1624]MBD2371421.1 hypothetical protein [Leptolyngbya sp. FACHB-161]
MLNLKKLQTSTALALTIGVTATGAAPIVFAKDAIAATPAPMKVAQLFPSSPSSPTQTTGAFRIPAGTTLRLAYRDAEKILVAPNERLPITLTVPNNIRTSNGTLLIPAGSQVKGEFQPADGGTRFVANTLILNNGNQVALNGQTDLVTRTEEIRRGVSTDAILKGAAIGSGAAAIISGITGNRRITLGKVLIGTGAGALGGLLLGRNRNQVISVNQSDLNLRLNSALAVNAY